MPTRKAKRPVQTAVVFILATIATFLGWRLMWPSIRSTAFGYSVTEVQAEEIADAKFTCPGTNRTLFIQDAERIKAVASMMRRLKRLPGPPGGRIGTAGASSAVVASRIRFHDGGFAVGYWTIEPDPYFVMYQPESTLTDYDPGPYFHTEDAQGNQRCAAFVRDLMALCEPATVGD